MRIRFITAVLLLVFLFFSGGCATVADSSSETSSVPNVPSSTLLSAPEPLPAHAVIYGAQKYTYFWFARTSPVPSDAPAPPNSLHTIYTLPNIQDTTATESDAAKTVEGYIAEVDYDHMITEWALNDETITLKQTLFKKKLYVDAEKADPDQVNVLAQKAYLYPETQQLIWSNGHYVFTLQVKGRNKTAEQLIALAETLAPHERSEQILLASRGSSFRGGNFSEEWQSTYEPLLAEERVSKLWNFDFPTFGPLSLAINLNTLEIPETVSAYEGISYDLAAREQKIVQAFLDNRAYTRVMSRSGRSYCTEGYREDLDVGGYSALSFRADKMLFGDYEACTDYALDGFSYTRAVYMDERDSIFHNAFLHFDNKNIFLSLAAENLSFSTRQDAIAAVEALLAELDLPPMELVFCGGYTASAFNRIQLLKGSEPIYDPATDDAYCFLYQQKVNGVPISSMYIVYDQEGFASVDFDFIDISVVEADSFTPCSVQTALESVMATDTYYYHEALRPIVFGAELVYNFKTGRPAWEFAIRDCFYRPDGSVFSSTRIVTVDTKTALVLTDSYKQFSPYFSAPEYLPDEFAWYEEVFDPFRHFPL